MKYVHQIIMNTCVTVADGVLRNGWASSIVCILIPCVHAGNKVQCTLANHESYCACTRQFMLHATHVLGYDASNYYQAFYEINTDVVVYAWVNLCKQLLSL